MNTAAPNMDQDEVVPGLVALLDPELLTAEPGCTTNAQIDREVQGPHLFLVLAIDDLDRHALAVPLFSSRGKGSVLLEQSLKNGVGFWTGAPSYFSPWQHWWIPVDRLVTARLPDQTSRGHRNHYATGEPGELGRIAGFRRHNRCPWRGV